MIFLLLLVMSFIFHSGLSSAQVAGGSYTCEVLGVQSSADGGVWVFLTDKNGGFTNKKFYFATQEGEGESFQLAIFLTALSTNKAVKITLAPDDNLAINYFKILR
jgi:hypothetical protein